MRTINFSLFVLLGLAVAAPAQVTYVITVNTTPLVDHPAGPFALAFQLADGSGFGDGNNAAVISSFQFGAGGAATGTPQLLGGASGSLSSTVVLVDTGFPNNLFMQTFTAGTSLSFQLALSSNSEAGDISDEFVVSILDRTGTPIPTLYGAPLDVLISIELGSADPTIQTFSSDPARSPVGGGGPISDLAAPSVTPNLDFCATDVTSQFQVSPGGFRFDNGTQQFIQTVMLQSITTNQQPVSLVLDSLSSSALLFNQDSKTICAPALGSPYINVPSGSTSIVLSFVDPTLVGIKYKVRVLSGSGVR